LEFFFVGLILHLELLGEVAGLVLGLHELRHIAGNPEGAFDLAETVAPREFRGDHPGFITFAPGFVFELVNDSFPGLDDAFLVVFGGFPVIKVKKIPVVLTCQVAAL